MKKISALILAAILFLCIFSGCGKQTQTQDEPTVRIGVLSGPTGIGALKLWDNAGKGETAQKYEISLAASNDEIVAAVSSGSIDIAAVATNLAASLYNKTSGGVTVLALNTGSVLNLLAKEELSLPSGLKGKDIFLTGQGANPEYIVRYALKQCGLNPDSDVNLHFVSDANELSGIYASPENEKAVVVAPQPAATAIKGKFNCKTVVNLSEIGGDAENIVMGCVIVRNEFLKEHKKNVDTFLREYETSITAAKENVNEVSELAAEKGIIASASLATAAIPKCDLIYTDGNEMRQKLSAYLNMLFAFDPKSVGDKLPESDFYYEKS